MKILNIKNIFIAATCIVMTTGCAQVGPKTQKGALIGAGTGAVVGAVTGGSVVKSAVVGTAIGAGVGYMQDTN